MSRRVVTASLRPEHVQRLDAVSAFWYRTPRARIIARALDLFLPLAEAECAKNDPERWGHSAPKYQPAALPTGVVDLAQRRAERMRRKMRERW